MAFVPVAPAIFALLLAAVRAATHPALLRHEGRVIEHAPVVAAGVGAGDLAALAAEEVRGEVEAADGGPTDGFIQEDEGGDAENATQDAGLGAGFDMEVDHTGDVAMPMPSVDDDVLGDPTKFLPEEHGGPVTIEDGEGGEVIIETDPDLMVPVLGGELGGAAPSDITTEGDGAGARPQAGVGEDEGGRSVLPNGGAGAGAGGETEVETDPDLTLVGGAQNSINPENASAAAGDDFIGDPSKLPDVPSGSVTIEDGQGGEVIIETNPDLIIPELGSNLGDAAQDDVQTEGDSDGAAIPADVGEGADGDAGFGAGGGTSKAPMTSAKPQGRQEIRAGKLGKSGKGASPGENTRGKQGQQPQSVNGGKGMQGKGGNAKSAAAQATVKGGKVGKGMQGKGGNAKQAAAKATIDVDEDIKQSSKKAKALAGKNVMVRGRAHNTMG